VLTVPAGLALVTEPTLAEALGGGEYAGAPALLWPVWGVALMAATVAYARRRQGRCPHLDA
jgi:hypothetical protein